VYRRKPNGRLKKCLDPKDLNAIQRDHHVTPILEEILPKLNGATHFSILDARSGCWNVTLDEESSYLTTFTTHFTDMCIPHFQFSLPNAVRKREKMRNAHITEMRSNSPFGRYRFNAIRFKHVTGCLYSGLWPDSGGA
jgi:hypothetical protein